MDLITNQDDAIRDAIVLSKNPETIKIVHQALSDLAPQLVELYELTALDDTDFDMRTATVIIGRWREFVLQWHELVGENVGENDPA